MDENKKKRGRKPKADAASVTSSTTTTTTTTDDKTKRGRKPKTIYNTYDVSSPTNQTAAIGSSLSDDENIIVRLNVADEEEKVEEDPHPYAYNRDEYRDILKISDISTLAPPPPPMEKPSDLKVINILKDFEEKNKNKEWPSNTSICCYWCCHKFENAPFGIPVTYQSNTFFVFGCFCSLECATAHNFNTTNNIDEMWERYNLINLLARKIQYAKTVRPAPDRLALKSFGGYMDIEQFRDYHKTNKIININFPPMSSLSQQIEEINEYELNTDYKYIPLDHDRINKIKEQMVIKRNKPLINNKNSLENSMNLKFG